MSVKASGGSSLARPPLYRTVSLSTISVAEQQNRFLQLAELNELVNFLNSGILRLRLADLLAKNADLLVSRAANKIFIGGSPISYLEKPQSSFLSDFEGDLILQNRIPENEQNSLLSKIKLAFDSGESVPPGFKPINISRYGPDRMKKSLRDLDWFLRYLTYAIIAGDPNILVVNVRGLRSLIENACSSTATVVALKEMRKIALNIVGDSIDYQELLLNYFNVLISEFDSAPFTDRVRKRNTPDLQGLRLPQTYIRAGITRQKFVMKSSLSMIEKELVIRSCYSQIFQRDIVSAYSLRISNLESRLKNGDITMKEFVRALGKSYLYRKEFLEPFVNSRVVELSFRNFLGRGPGSLDEFRKYFGILSNRGLDGLIDAFVNSSEYTDYFGEETVPYLRPLGEEPQECRSWSPQINLLNYSSPFKKVPEFVTLYGDYNGNLPDQHPYGVSNDPLAIQFGAIFPQMRARLSKKSAFFSKDSRRILIRKGAGIYNQVGRPNINPNTDNTLGPRIFQLDRYSPVVLKNTKTKTISNIQAIIRASYLRVFGRLVYEEEAKSLKKIETYLLENKITLREFIRLLAKTSIFKALYWQPFYICKAIEYIHNRLLGRPTYSRREIDQYFSISYKSGYDSFIDSLIDSTEYLETFGDNIVPYERYLTPQGLSQRVFRGENKLYTYNSKRKKEDTEQFLAFGQFSRNKSINTLKKQIAQGVNSIRNQKVVFQYKKNVGRLKLEQIIKAAYRQIFERDISSCMVDKNFFILEEAFLAEEMTVKELIQHLGLSSLYAKEFYEPYPNSKVIELGTKHFLGRAPSSQAEIRFYNQILASQGLTTFICIMVNSEEYLKIFGTSTVPYRRFPTLPAANFSNTNRIYNAKTKQKK
uniref:Phycobiliprotein ApcE n=1 Tax=Neogoniolithon spectabile TaxID=231755 RepID=A0A3G3MGW6_9FLOR|nr:phycobilisome core-membrane linker protein [Neogoniolithon spectabile]AYR06063.1 phycobilisome core-membrane linker protein [Neogoniolithon spectabile]